MDEVTLVGAALIGAGLAILGLALVAVRRRTARARVRRRDARRRPVPGPAPGARPAPPKVAPPQATMPRATPPKAGTPPRRGPVADPARRRPPPPKTGEALDGETLQLGPVPAWKLPVPTRNGAPAQAAPGPNGTPRARMGGTALFARTREGRRNEAHAAQASTDPAPVPVAEATTAMEAIETSPAQPLARFEWFTAGR